MRHNIFASPRDRARNRGSGESSDSNVPSKANSSSRSRVGVIPSKGVVTEGSTTTNTSTSPAVSPRPPTRSTIQRAIEHIRRDPALMAAIVMGFFAMYSLYHAFFSVSGPHGDIVIPTNIPVHEELIRATQIDQSPSETPNTPFKLSGGAHENLSPIKDEGSTVTSPSSRTADFPPEFRRTRQFQSLQVWLGEGGAQPSSWDEVTSQDLLAAAAFSEGGGFVPAPTRIRQLVLGGTSSATLSAEALRGSTISGTRGNPRTTVAPSATPAVVRTIDVEAVFPHDPSAFTQGFEVLTAAAAAAPSAPGLAPPTPAGVVVVESTGLYGQSELRRIDLTTGRILARVALPNTHFGEGLSVRMNNASDLAVVFATGIAASAAAAGPPGRVPPPGPQGFIPTDEVFVLTWKEGVCHVYDAASLAHKRSLPLPAASQASSGTVEGWGLAVDEDAPGHPFIHSDGTSLLRWLDPDTLRIIRELRVVEWIPTSSLSTTTSSTGTQVESEGVFRPVSRLNELEYVHGRIVANVWFSDKLAVINPDSGLVEKWIDCSALHPLLSSSDIGSLSQTLARPPPAANARRDPNAVLNGIAYDKEGDRLFVTGKLWDAVYQVKEQAIFRAGISTNTFSASLAAGHGQGRGHGVMKLEDQPAATGAFI